MIWYQPSWLFTELTIALVKITLLLVICWIISFGFKKQSAAFRHRLWGAGILGALLLPLAAVLIPTHYARDFTRTVTRWADIAKSAPLAVSHLQPETAFVPWYGSATQKPNYAMYVPALTWAAGFLFASLRLLAGIMQLRNTTLKSKSVTEMSWQRIEAKLIPRLGIRDVRILQCTNATAMPLTWGVVRPVVLLPLQSTEWSEERRYMVLAHELAHVARHDWILQLCAEMLCCLYWFHPLAWLASRKLRHEGEQACDDVVVRLGIRASDYASELLELARTLGSYGRGSSMALAVVHSSHLERRFVAMLTPTLDHSLLTRKSKWMIAAAALSMMLPLAALRLPAQNASTETSAAPRGWYLAGNKPANYTTGVGPDTVYRGRPSAFLKSRPSATDGFGTLMQDFSAEQYLGKRVRLTAYVKSEKVIGWSGLWMRVDKGTAQVAFDNMQDRPIQGTTDWQTYSLVLDVPQDATGIFFGMLLEKGGEVWLNGVQFEIVGKEVPTTRVVSGASQPKAPVNLNFEE